MSRLVAIDEVIRVAENTFPKEDVRKIMWVLCHTPTAYDVEKVVAELEVMEEKRVRFAKQILDYWDKQGTQQTILLLKDIVENSEVQNERIYRKVDW